MEKYKKLKQYSKFETSAPTRNDKYELPDGSYSASNIQDYFPYILKKHGEKSDKLSVHIYVNKIENRVTFEIKDGCSLKLLTSETMKSLGSTKNKMEVKTVEMCRMLKLLK